VFPILDLSFPFSLVWNYVRFASDTWTYPPRTVIAKQGIGTGTSEMLKPESANVPDMAFV
jgi:hypothetical protein